MHRPLLRVALGLSLGLVLIAGCTSSGSGASPLRATASPAAGSAGPGGSTACPKTAPAPFAEGEKATVRFGTRKGPIVIEVDGALGPRAAANFVALSECGYYVGTPFHRIMPGFVIQGGDPTGTGTGGPGYTFPDDPVTVPYTRGTVAMANSGPNTNGSQFFIILADSGLDPKYSVFGRVVDGMDTVDAIAKMPNSGGQSGTALDPVVIDTVTVTRP